MDTFVSDPEQGSSQGKQLPAVAPQANSMSAGDLVRSEVTYPVVSHRPLSETMS